MGSRGIVGVCAVRESAEGGVDHLLGETGGVTLMLMSYTEDEFASMIGVNLAGFFRTTQLAIPHMLTQGGGHTVSIAPFVTGEILQVDGGQGSGR